MRYTCIVQQNFQVLLMRFDCADLCVILRFRNILEIYILREKKLALLIKLIACAFDVFCVIACLHSPKIRSLMIMKKI